jgi:hypothetical protein
MYLFPSSSHRLTCLVEDHHLASPKEQTSRSTKNNTNSTGSTASVNSSLPPNQPVGYLSGRTHQEADSKRSSSSRAKVEIADVTELDTSVGSIEKKLPQTRSFIDQSTAVTPLKTAPPSRLEMRYELLSLFHLMNCI